MTALSAEAAKLPPVGMMMPINGEITSRFPVLAFTRSWNIPRAPGRRPGRAGGHADQRPAAGRVASVGRRLGYGLVVEMVHSGGVVTRFAHLRSSLVHAGDTVTMGQEIAKVGESGVATAPHLHFEVWVKGTAVDPVKFVAATRLATPVATVH